MWIARLMATFPHIHSPAKHQTFFVFRFKVKTDRSDSNLDWNLLAAKVGAGGTANGVPPTTSYGRNASIDLDSR
jgi:hypothetical protein